MSDRACHLDAQKSRDAKKEATDAGDHCAPKEYASVPILFSYEHLECANFPMKEDERGQENNRAGVRPVG